MEKMNNNNITIIIYYAAGKQVQSRQGGTSEGTLNNVTGIYQAHVYFFTKKCKKIRLNHYTGITFQRDLLYIRVN